MEATAAAVAAAVLRDKLKEKYKQRKVSGRREGSSDKDIKFLNKELRSIRAAVSMLSDLPQDELDKPHKLYARQWRELSYDIEDFLDTLPHLRKGLVKKMAYPFHKRDRTGRHIAGEIRALKARIMETAEWRSMYKVDEWAAADGPARGRVDPRVMALYRPASDLVGIDEARDELVRRLTEGDGASYLQLKIVSLVGLAGLGKTTLAILLYDKIKSTFDCSVFVSLSWSPNMMRVFTGIFYDLGSEEYRRDIHGASWDQAKAIDKLKNFLQSKRYLIIVDDIWDTKSWRIIKQALVDNNLGSRIITTTRKLDVAEEIGGAYKVKPLSQESSRILFYRRVFDTDECPIQHEFAEMSDAILKKCGGVPLFIISVASLLAVGPKTMHRWRDILEVFCSGLELGHNDTIRSLRRIISLSYYNLPSHLKACLLHASVFPDGHLIRRDSLVRMWIAEGFIQEKQGYNLFEVGQSYVDELLKSSMIQEVDAKDGDNIDDMIKYCCVPTMVLYFICWLSKEQNFVTRIPRSYDQRNIRRILFLQDGAVGPQRVPETDGCLSKVRSVTAFGSGISLVPVLSRFKVLRVMDLEGTDLQGCNLKNLGKLLLLRYLGLRDTLIADLPTEIGNLGMLQTLDLKGTRIKDLPSTVARLRRLLCLYVECTTKHPQGIGNLASLEELSSISITECPMLAEVVSSLAELRVLGIVLQRDDANESFLESLCNLKKLQTLRISGRGGTHLEYFMSELWVPPPALRMFVAVHCWFSALPTWISSTNLTELQIGVRKLLREGLEILGRLQELRTLNLAAEHMMEELAVDADAFPRLRFLRLRCGTCLVFRRGAMPEIQKMEFVLDVHSSTCRYGGGQFDWGLENLTSLEQVSATLRHVSGSEAVLEAESALKNAMGIHPNRPDLEITMVPFPSHEQQEQEQEQEDAAEENSIAGPPEIRECSA